ncbi:carbohydrate ABC transporter permease [Frigidibacter sp. MR17.24]|uniref:carbohydrate ABC transporter permease n=1 Tax=Frigidibacter sp. MR17.24 TaxID=3127345 RepID=UPI003012E8D7
MSEIAGTRSRLRVANYVAVIALVLLWTIPTIGLLVSSFRDREQIQSLGWWQALSSAEEPMSARTGPPGDAVQEDGQWVLTGNVFGDGTGTVGSFGTSIRAPGEFPAGETAETRDGGTLSIAADGAYRLTSPEPFKGRRGERLVLTRASPPEFTLQNYVQVMTADGMGQAFLNTLTVTIPATVIPILVAAFAAYALAWMQFPGRALLIACVVGLLVVPLQLSLIPLLRFHNGIGLGRSYIGIWLAHTGFGMPLAIYLLRNYMVGLPKEVIECARVDGATEFEIFRKIVLPLSLPALAAFGIFQFLWTWNDLLVAKVFLGSGNDQMVMTGRIVELLGSRGNNWELLTAAAFISMLVPLVVFFSMQKYFVRGLLAGSVKGG